MPSSPPLRGGIYLVADHLLTLPPNDDRIVHPQRPVLVLSGPETNNDPAWPFVLVAPFSSSTTLKTAYCVKISAGEGNTPKKSWVRVTATQPLMKEHLRDYSGPLPAARLDEVDAQLLRYMGLID